MDVHRVVFHVKCHVGHAHKIVGEILLDLVCLLAGANDEVLQSVCPIDLHDMPEDRLPPNLHHRLGFEVGFFTEAAPETARQYDDFHFQSSTPYGARLFSDCARLCDLKIGTFATNEIVNMMLHQRLEEIREIREAPIIPFGISV